MLAFYVLFLGFCVLDSEGKKILLILKHFAFDTWLSFFLEEINGVIDFHSFAGHQCSMNNITCLKCRNRVLCEIIWKNCLNSITF